MHTEILLLSSEIKHSDVTNHVVRVTFDGNSFHPAEGPFIKNFADLLHSYWLGQGEFIQAFARLEIFYYGAITVASFSR